MAIAGSAPAYSITVTTAALVAATGVAGGAGSVGPFGGRRGRGGGWVAGTGAGWLLGVLALITFGIKVSAKAQVVFLSLEIFAVVLLCGLAIFDARAMPAAPFSWNW